MLLSHKTTVELNNAQSNIVGHMCYAASKLWNACNYERRNYKTLGLAQYPDWYYQKKVHKDNFWFKQLPAQTSQEVCKLLDGAWKSFYKLQKTQGILNPRPPRFKQKPMSVTLQQMGIVHESGSDTIRLSIARQMKEYLRSAYNIHDNYLFLKNSIFKNMDTIKQIVIYPSVKDKCEVIVVYEIPDTAIMPDNGRYLSIDPGIHNLLTCYDSATGETFIAGRRYLSICRRFDKEIARVQSQWSLQQSRNGVKYPKSSKHISALQRSKKSSVRDYLHKATRAIVSYCEAQDIHTVVIGDITNIRRGKNFGSVTNQKLHVLPYRKIYQLLEYKFSMKGVTIIKQKESYSSQVSPLQPEVSKQYAVKSSRRHRGLYQDGDYSWNADCVGAYNILRLHLQEKDPALIPDPFNIKIPYVLKVAV